MARQCVILCEGDFRSTTLGYHSDTWEYLCDTFGLDADTTENVTVHLASFEVKQ